MWSDRTTISAPTKSSKQSPPFDWAVKLSALFIAVVATFGVAELLLALVAGLKVIAADCPGRTPKSLSRSVLAERTST